MSLTSKIHSVIQLGWNAATSNGVRKAPSTRTKGEQAVATASKRRRIMATSMDLMRNAPVARWAVEKYLDHTATFSFQAKTVDTSLNRELEKAMRWWSRPYVCDVTGRHTLDEMIRLFARDMLIDGDSALLKTVGEDGVPRIQGIEGNRISSEGAGTPAKLVEAATEGLVMDSVGSVLSYLVCMRDKSGNRLNFVRDIKPRNMIYDGYFFRFDQPRGISPLAVAINQFKDLMEANEYQLIKAKMHAMFGIVIKSQDTVSGFNEEDVSDDDSPSYEFDMPVGMKLELNPGDDITTVESKTPSNEYQSFVEQVMRSCLAVLGIPYSFFDSRQSSYSAQKQDCAEFDLYAKTARNKHRSVLDRLTRWVLPYLVEAFDIDLGGMDVRDIPFYWQDEGTPWLDEYKEAQAASLRIATGISSRSIETRRRGHDFLDIAEDLSREQKMLDKLGVISSLGQPGQNLLDFSEDETDEDTGDNK